eukprot:s464_g3.t2
MAMLKALVLVFLPGANLVAALRDNHALAHQQGTICWRKCCTSKCDSETHQFKGDLGPVKFQDCQVKKNKPLEIKSETMCEETCQIPYFGESKPVKVLRKSGHGTQQCTLQKDPKDQGICEDDCCAAKCSGQSYSLKSEWKGQWQFQNCTVRKKSQEVQGYGTVCVEDCTVLHSKEPQKAKVTRRSGPVAPQCQLYHGDLALHELAMDFVQQLETKALTLTDGNYEDLPLMKAGTVKSFLKKLKNEVLQPELDQQGYSQEINATKKAVILGDLHGQLFNLISFLILIKDKYKEKGFSTLEGSSLLFCDPGIQYVFMGDYVDRGERGLELLLLLLAYKARCPQGMVLLQGNHETKKMWKKYGFAKELEWKFHGKLSTGRFRKVLELLPYVAAAPGQFMALHGGLSPELESACTGKGGRFSECLTKDIGQTTVWPDPHNGKGYIKSSRGRKVKKFGMDLAEAFLKSNNLRAMFRGHEQVKAGFEQKTKGDHVVATVFSAADYVGLFCPDGRQPGWDAKRFSSPGEGNYGAMVLVDRKSGSAKFKKLSPRRSRALASKFTGARCTSGTSSLQASQSESLAYPPSKATLESFIEENHRHIKLKHLAHGNFDSFDSCSLEKDETESLKEEVRQILSNSEDPEFEARKLIDLQGEGLIHGEDIEICKAIQKDKITLEVYNELDGVDEKILDNDIETREYDLEEATVGSRVPPLAFWAWRAEVAGGVDECVPGQFAAPQSVSRPNQEETAGVGVGNVDNPIVPSDHPLNILAQRPELAGMARSSSASEAEQRSESSGHSSKKKKAKSSSDASAKARDSSEEKESEKENGEVKKTTKDVGSSEESAGHESTDEEKDEEKEKEESEDKAESESEAEAKAAEELKSLVLLDLELQDVQDEDCKKAEEAVEAAAGKAQEARSRLEDAKAGPEVTTKSAWLAKVDEQDMGASDAVNPRAAESQVVPQKFMSLEERLEGVWSRKDDGKPLGEIAQGQLVWDTGVLIIEEPCMVQTSGQDVVKITIRDHDFYGRVFFSSTGDAAMMLG